MRTVQARTQPAAGLREELHRAVLDSLHREQLDTVEAIADALNLLPIAAGALLRRSSWPIETSLRLIDVLDLPIEVGVRSHSG